MESQSIHIIREVASEFDNPVMLYSIGKDSSVMLHLARKAFYPGKIPFPLLHIDTSYKFDEMISFRDQLAKELDIKLIVHSNTPALDKGMNPWSEGTVTCCGALKTKALLDALKEGGFDAAFGGARRDEEKSRAKERIYSFRDRNGQWNPKRQRPELWQNYNGKIGFGESIRVFPLSNWTELDIWTYIRLEQIPISDLYFGQPRLVIKRNNQLIPYVAGKTPLQGEEQPQLVNSRFRTLGCWPCTGAVPSNAVSIDDIIEETMTVRLSERTTRIIDHDQDSSMEQKKREGYF